MDYQKYLKGRVLIISGVGRSGTTIIGKILGSCKNTHYFFEPAIMKYFTVLFNNEFLSNTFKEQLKELFLGTLFEDYILPAVQGRNVNINQKDWTYFGNYQTKAQLLKRFKLNRRLQALEHLEKTEPYFIFKCNEAQYLYDTYDYLFEDLKILHVNRKIEQVITSMMERGWYGDDYQPIDYINSDGIPCFVEPNVFDKWKNYWNSETRAAYVWGRLNKLANDYNDRNIDNDNIKMVDYRTFKYYPNNTMKEIFEWCDLKPTTLTKNHIQSVMNFVDMFKDEDYKKVMSKVNFGV